MTVAHTTAARESERGCIECLCQAREYSLGTKLTRTWSLSPRPISSERHPRHRRGPWPSSPREMNSVHISEMIQVSTVYFEKLYGAWMPVLSDHISRDVSSLGHFFLVG